MDLQRWLSDYLMAVKAAFNGRIVCVGIQGSYGRGEATADSDLDMVLILDTLSMDDLHRYRKATEALPERDKLCGFVCGKRELTDWEKSDVYSLFRDTTPVLGDLEFLRPLLTEADKRRSVLTAACALYHACCHNYLFEQNTGALPMVRKSVFFMLRAECECRTGEYVKRRVELLPKLNAQQRALLESDLGPDEYLQGLLDVCATLIRSYGSAPEKE